MWGKYSGTSLGSTVNRRQYPRCLGTGFIQRCSLALIGIVMACVPAIAVQTSGNADFSKPREWRTKTGASFTAAAIAVKKDHAVFKKDGEEAERSLPLGNLIPQDEAILRVAYFGQQDQMQFDTTRSLMERVVTNASDSADVLKQSHLDYPDSPYAGLWASVCLSAGSNKNVEASSILRQVTARIERQREFDRNRHSMTLASALNNLAICMIKSHKADSAAGLLAQSLESAPVHSAVVAQNARQLLEIGRNQTAALALKQSSLQRLERSLLTVPTESTGLSAGWFFSLDADLPSSVIGAQPIIGLEAPSPGLDPTRITTGLAVSTKTVVASAMALGIGGNMDGKSEFTVVQFGNGSEMQTLDSRVLKRDESSGLVALKVPEASFATVSLQRSPAVSGNDIALFSYGVRNSRIGPGSLRSTTGKLDGAASNPFQRLKIAQTWDGPVVDRRAQVLGIAQHDQVAQEVQMAQPPLLANFAGEFVDADKTTDITGFDHVRAACVLVVHWRVEGNDKPLYLHQEPGASGATSISVRDDWCITCKGLGFVACANCVKGKTAYRKRVQVGVNTLTRQPIYGTKSFPRTCSSCSGRGGFPCRHCRNGKLR